MDAAQGLHYGRHIAMQSQNRRQEKAYGERFEGPPGCGRKRQKAAESGRMSAQGRSEGNQTLSSFTVASMSISSSEKINVVP